MQEYKYTYQDWAEGKIEPSIIGRLLRMGRLITTDAMSAHDLDKIAIKQHEAFLYYLSTTFEGLKRLFINQYDDSLLKDEYLDEHISGFKLILDAIRTEHEVIVTSALNPINDGRFELTKSEVDIYLSAKADSEDMELFAWRFITDIEDAGIEFGEEEKAPFKYILRSNFYKWLLWFKNQQELKNLEPSLDIDPNNLPKEIAELIESDKSYTWLSNPDSELPELYQLLLDKKLIQSDTTPEQFKTIFTGQSLNSIKPIKWHDDNASELLYFIMQLESSGNIEASKRTNYKRLKGCFVKPDGKSFDNAFKSLKQRIDSDLSDQKQQTIREIIGNF